MKKMWALLLLLVLLVICVSAAASGEPLNKLELRPMTIDAGQYHLVALKEDGTVLAFFRANKDDNFGQCKVQKWKDIVSIDAGSYTTLGLKADGTVVAAGHNKFGQCKVTGWKDIIGIGAGHHHSVGLKKDGTVVATGRNNCGQCNVKGWKDIVAITTGGDHTVGLKADGTVVATGENCFGQCNVSSWKDIVAIAANGTCTVGLKKDGTVVYAGGYDSAARQTLAVMTRWTDVVGIYAQGIEKDVFAVMADGFIGSTVGRSVGGGSQYTAAAFCSWKNEGLYLQADGSVLHFNRFPELDGVKIKQPYLYQLNKEQDVAEKNTGIWVVRAFVDEFDLPTNEYYLTNLTRFGGTFSNSLVEREELTASLTVSADENRKDQVCLFMYEYGKYKVQNLSTTTWDKYRIVVMDCNGKKYNTTGVMYTDRMYFDDPQLILNILKMGGTVRFSITEKDAPSNKYVITIPVATGFDAAYIQYWNK